MPETITIPLVTLPVGTRTVGPTSVADSDTVAIVLIDRTVTNGLNSKTSSTTIVLAVSQSNDNGTTWTELESATVVGGTLTVRGVQQNTSEIGITLAPATGRQIRATITVAGSSVAVSGSLTIQ